MGMNQINASDHMHFKRTYATNLNDCITPGSYGLHTAYTSNAPSNTAGSTGTVLVMTYGGDAFRVFQLCLMCNDNANAASVHLRHSYHSGGQRLWSGWTKLH